MSLFNRKPIVFKEPKLDESFKIIQFIKIEGLKKNKQKNINARNLLVQFLG